MHPVGSPQEPGSGPVRFDPVSQSSTLTESIATRSDAVGVEIVAVVLFASVLSLWGLRSGPGLSDHEAIVAVGARTMIQTGNWLVPTVGREEFLRKPPLPFWLAAISATIVDDPVLDSGVSEAAARLPSAIAAILTVTVVLLLARSMYGHRTGVVTAGVLATSAGLLFFAHNAQVEMVLTFFSTCAVASFWFATRQGARRHLWWVLFYLSLGFAMLAKAPLPALTVVLPLAVWWFVTVPLALTPDASGGGAVVGASSRLAAFVTQLRRVRHLWIVPGVLVFAVVFAPLPIYLYLTRPGTLDLWRIEFLDRYAGDLSSRAQPAYYYLPLAFGLVFPWSLSLPEAIVAGFLPRNRPHRAALLFALTWVAVQTVLLSTSAFKRPHYLVGTLPGMALLLGPAVDRFFLRVRDVSRQRLWLAGMGLLALLSSLSIWGWTEVAKNMPDAIHAFRTALPLLLAGAVVSFVTFAWKYRTTSLAVLLGTTAVTFACSWDTIGQRGSLDGRLRAMIRAIQETTIGPTDRMTWAAGRPDARLMYYSNLDIERLFTALELAPKRDGRREVPAWLATDALTEIRKRLSSPKKEYFVVLGRHWDAFRSAISDTATMICRVSDEQADPMNDWVLFTQSWNTDWKSARQ